MRDARQAKIIMAREKVKAGAFSEEVSFEMPAAG